MALALHETPAWFAPIVLLPVALTVAWRGSPLMRGAAYSLMLSTGFFWGGDLFGKAYVLSMPFYYSFLLPVTTLAAAAFCGELIQRQAGRGRMWVAILFAFAVLMPAIAARWEIGLRVMGVSALVLALAVLIPSRKWSQSALVAIGVASLFLAIELIAMTGMFHQFLGHYGSKDLPVLELASRLREMIPTARADQESTCFWYDDNPTSPGSSDRRMIGSFWLHYFGKLMAAGGGCVPFGIIDPVNATALRENGPDRIVIFDQDTGRSSAAAQAFISAGIPYRTTSRAVLEAPSDSKHKLSVVMLERLLPLSEDDPKRRAKWIQMHRGKLIASQGDEMEFLSSRIKWWDPFAQAHLGSLRKGDRMVIPYMVRNGRVRFALGEKGKGPVMVEKWPSDHSSVLVLTAPSDMSDAVISLRNRYPTGSVSRISVGSVLVFNGE
jgi:hypothetical protein